ncbi:acyltransferase family protein [Solidesulfovibrio sp.]
MPRESQKPPFLPGLGGLRALAALAVLVGHAAAWITPLPGDPVLYSPLARLTQCGLSAFFVLSGFVLQYTHGPALAAGGHTARFALARAARLYPVYLLFLGLAVGGLLLTEPAAVTQAPANLLAFVSLTHSWFFTPGVPKLFPLAWALSVEVFFYGLFPLMARGLARLATPRAALLAALGAWAAVLALDALIAAGWPRLFALALARHPDWAGASGAFAGVLFQWLTYASPYLRIFEFALGAAVARFFVLRPAPLPGLDMAAAVGLGALLLAPFPADAFFLAVLANNALYAPCLAALCLAWAGRPRAWTSHRLLARIGTASLSVYLVQAWTLPLFAAPAGASALVWTPLALAGLAVTVAAGLVLTRLVEAPAARYLLSRPWLGGGQGR